jgi:hypothetical protein
VDRCRSNRGQIGQHTPAQACSKGYARGISSGCAPGCRYAQLGHASWSEPFEPVEPLGTERGHPGHDDHTQDAFRKQRGTCQGMRTATGMTHEREPLDALSIGDCGGVGGRRRHVPVWAGGRPVVAGAGVRYPADAEPGRGREKGLWGGADVRRAVVPEDGEPAASSAPMWYACSLRPSPSSRSVSVTIRLV